MLFLKKLATFCFLLLLSADLFSSELTVPGIGSRWVSTLEYLSLQDGDHGQSNNLPRRRDEISVVTNLKNGVPVFAGEVFGYKGEITETANGTVVYTDDCKEFVPAAIFVPPPIPNQCVWHVCVAPNIGETLERKMTFYVKLYSCKPKLATYTFTSVRQDLHDGREVTIGRAKVYFDAFRQTEWESYIQKGYGEVYAKSPSRETTYKVVAVNQVPYIANGQKLETGDSNNKRYLAKENVPQKCDIVAFGDSLVEGMGASQEESFPSQLSKIINYSVCNLGISGNTTEIAKMRTEEVVDLHPKVVIIGLGANDAFQGVSSKVTLRNLERIIRSFREKEIFVILLGFKGSIATAPAYLNSMINVQKEVTDGKEGVLLLPDAFKGVLGVNEFTSSDGLHPNALGYKRIAANIADQAFGDLRVIGWTSR